MYISYKAVHYMAARRTQAEMLTTSLAQPRARRNEVGDSTSSSLMGSIRVVLRRVDGAVARGGATRTGVGVKGGAVRAEVGAMTWLNSSVEGKRRVGIKDAEDETKVSGGAMGRSSLLLAVQPWTESMRVATKSSTRLSKAASRARRYSMSISKASSRSPLGQEYV